MFAKIARPSSTAATIVAKLSSASTMSAASFETSVPVMPMATPMSAFFSAGASLTPSPVIATTAPFALQRLDDAQLVLGIDARVDRHLGDRAASASSDSFSSSAPVMARPSAAMPELLSDDRRRSRVVAGDHQRTNAGAPCARATASFASARGGSIMPISPANTRSCSTRSSTDARHERLAFGSHRPATPSVRSASPASASLVCRISARRAARQRPPLLAHELARAARQQDIGRALGEHDATRPCLLGITM